MIYHHRPRDSASGDRKRTRKSVQLSIIIWKFLQELEASVVSYQTSQSWLLIARREKSYTYSICESTSTAVCGRTSSPQKNDLPMTSSRANNLFAATSLNINADSSTLSSPHSKIVEALWSWANEASANVVAEDCGGFSDIAWMRLYSLEFSLFHWWSHPWCMHVVQVCDAIGGSIAVGMFIPWTRFRFTFGKGHALAGLYSSSTAITWFKEPHWRTADIALV